MALNRKELAEVCSRMKVKLNTELSRMHAIDTRDHKLKPKRLIDMDNIIEFLGVEKDDNNDKFGKYFSNCTDATVTIDGVTVPSSEHEFQLKKFRTCSERANERSRDDTKRSG